MKKTVIFALILSLLLALAACAGGSSPSPSAPADSPSPSQSTPSNPASPSDSPSPSPSPSPSEAEPSPSIDPALSKDGKFRAQSTLTEDPRSRKIGYGDALIDSFMLNEKSFEQLKEFNERNFAELYDVYGIELNEDILYDILYNKFEYQYDKYMGMFASKHKHVRDIATLFDNLDWESYFASDYRYKINGHSIGSTKSSALIRDYINNDRDDFDFSILGDPSSFDVRAWAEKQTGRNFMYINLLNVKMPTIEIITARAYTAELLAMFPFLRYNEEEQILIIAELNSIPYCYTFTIDEHNDFVVQRARLLSEEINPGESEFMTEFSISGNQII